MTFQAAGLVSTLDDSSAAITVFAPTDDAFAALASALNLAPAELLAKSDLLKVVSFYMSKPDSSHSLTSIIR